MATKNQALSVSKNEVNNLWKEEQKSFEFCIKQLAAMTDPKVSKYLSERGLSKAYLTAKGADKVPVCKAELFGYCNLHEFTAANGTTYKAIFTKKRDGSIVEAKWSIWRVLCAIDKKYAAESKANGLKEMKAKEESIQAIEASEKKANKKPATPASIKKARSGKKSNKKAA